MWWYYTGAIAAACAAGLGWLAVAMRGNRWQDSCPIIITHPLLIGALVLGCVSLIAFGDSTTGIHDALAHLPTSVVLLHRALHIALGVALAVVIWLLWQVFI